MEYRLELVLLPVADVDRAKAFYTEQAGFDLLVDTPVGEKMRVVQITPPGSGCSIGFGDGLGVVAAPGTTRGLHLIVSDIVAARDELIGRGVEVSGIRHIVDGAWHEGPHPDRSDYESFADFSDPDGNGWVLQEVKTDWRIAAANQGK
ncbi:MAG TPA: VOC family protein [Actinocrinis sp.]|jgi:catechol 2,3-dioxygenase-like lactoylglutathione lyase family enzyme|uniref:VOC family protein n=1 Tax=Actinocrinis sp. TaxID=1920516 RepID=UPI002DDD79EA|nr:VOC family protein [Actinocrinis sp.]HEV3169438.1 VOC family protein [Actinocrinis sp.]